MWSEAALSTNLHFEQSSRVQREAGRDPRLHLDPPERAIVLFADEKNHIQALGHTHPGLPRKKKVMRNVHLIADNYATYKHPEDEKWLAHHPCFHIYFTPTSSSWLNAVKRFFRDFTQNQQRRDNFREVGDLIMAIGGYIDQHDDNPKPFVWTAKASDTLERVKRARHALDNP